MAEKKPYTYEQIVKKVRKTFENADAREVFEHVAIEVDIVGEGAGAFYFEVAERACTIEPYNYYNHDGRIIATADVVMKLATQRMGVREASNAIHRVLFDKSHTFRYNGICGH